MSDDETVLVCRHSTGIYHTDPDCPRIKGFVNKDWTVEMAEAWGKTHCSHCQGPPKGVPNQSDIYRRISDPDCGPEDVGLSAVGEREVAHD